jgi:hypothetical protein
VRLLLSTIHTNNRRSTDKNTLTRRFIGVIVRVMENKPMNVTFPLNAQERALLDKLKPIYGSRNQAIRRAIYALAEKEGVK